MKFFVYCDETLPDLFTTTQKVDKKLMIGSLWIEEEIKETFKAKIKALRQKHNCWGEIKWTKVSKAKEKFSHAFYESSDRRGSKDLFSFERAKRIDWIKATLQSREALLFQGWDAKKKRYFTNRRVSVVYENFVVIIQIGLKRNGSLKANFITCYQADNSIEKIKASPVWEKEKCLEELQK